MTHIVSPTKYPTKKAFREAVAKDPSRVYLEDPSIFNPCSGSVKIVTENRDSITVTNHPKRSWFAAIRVVKGVIRVSCVALTLALTVMPVFAHGHGHNGHSHSHHRR